MNHGLSEKTVNKIFSVFERFPEIEKAVLYGSRAKGNFKTGSDIDLTLYGEKLSSRLLGDIAEALDDLLLPYTIDLSIFDNLNHAKLREHIERVGVVFYEKKNQNMKAGWEIKTLGEVCHFVRGPFGGSLKKSMFVESGIAVYEQQHAIYNQFDDIRYFVDDAKFEEMKRFELQPNDLIMSCSGTMGKVAIVPDNIQKGIINQALLKLTPSKSISSNFLSYWMTSPNFQNSLNEQSGGAAIQNVASVSILKEIKIKLPPLPEQKRLVTILDEAFESIATAKANAEQNLKNARALFESHLNEVFSKRGEGWEEKTLKEITTVLGDGLHGTPNYTDDGDYYFINGNNLTDGVIEFKDSTKRVSVDEFNKHNKHKKNLTDRTILVSINGTLGNVAFYNGEKVILGKSACYFNLKEGIDKNFVKCVFSSPYFLEYAHKEATGATIKNVSLKTMREFKVPLPPLAEQQTVFTKIADLSEETQRLEALYSRKIAALDELKKALLHRAFSGEL